MDHAGAVLQQLQLAQAEAPSKRQACALSALMAAEQLAAGDPVAARHILSPVAGALCSFRSEPECVTADTSEMPSCCSDSAASSTPAHCLHSWPPNTQLTVL